MGYLEATRTFWAICCSALRKATSGHITRRAAGINQGQVAPLLAQRRTIPEKADPTGPEGGVEQGHLLLPSHPQVLLRQCPATNSNPIPSRKKELRDLRQTQTESPGREKKNSSKELWHHYGSQSKKSGLCHGPAQKLCLLH